MESLFQEKRDYGSDINEHLDVLRNAAACVDTVVEMGVRSGVSSVGFAAGLYDVPGKWIHGVDLEPKPKIYEDLQSSFGLDVRFTQGNVLSIAPIPCDLLFIDTFHVYGQLKRELAHHADSTLHAIVLHDTTVDAEAGEAIRNGWNADELAAKTGMKVAEITKGLWPAVVEFLEAQKDTWRLCRRYVNNNGLTVLVRKGSLKAGQLELALPLGTCSTGVPLGKIAELGARVVSGLVSAEERCKFLNNSLTEEEKHAIVTRNVPPAKENGLTWDEHNVLALTMIGMKRLRGLAAHLAVLDGEHISGHVVETGVWRGGACIFASWFINKVLGNPLTRLVFGLDSFEGLPRPEEDKYPVDRGDAHFTQSALKVPKENVATSAALFGVDVEWIKGWFEHTCTALAKKLTHDGSEIALLRLDGDMYSSTIQTLNPLEPLVPRMGFVVIDDWALHGANSATIDYRASCGESAQIVSYGDGIAVFWRKTRSGGTACVGPE